MSAIVLDTREWSRSLKEYMAHTKRDLPYVINKKSFYIARRATRQTFKARAEDIKAAWAKEVEPIVRTGKTSPSRAGKAPLGGVLIEKLGKMGKIEGWPSMGFSPKVRAQWEAFKKFHREWLAKRLAARAYMAAGFKPAIKRFASVLGIPSNEALDKKGKNYNWSAMGGAAVAVPGIKAIASIWNSALAKHTDKPSEKLESVAGKALQSALNYEVASMDKFIENELQKTANKFSAKALR